MTEQMDIFDATASEAAKVAGEMRALDHLVDWREEADAWLRELIRSALIGDRDPVFTSEDIQADIGQPTDIDGRPNNAGVGGYIAGLARRGVIVKVGWGKSARVTNHGSDLRIWRVVKAP